MTERRALHNLYALHSEPCAIKISVNLRPQKMAKLIPGGCCRRGQGLESRCQACQVWRSGLDLGTPSTACLEKK